MTKTEPETLASIEELFPHMHKHPSELGDDYDPFTITTSNGFLPLVPAPTTLPEIFAPLASLLDRMPVLREDGKPGLLATYEFGPTVEAELPDLTHEIDNLLTADGKRDMKMITAIFRDYSYVASSYILEPCWEHWSKDNDSGYGLGRHFMPRCIAGPLYKTAEILNIPAFMSYAASYALYNWKLIDPKKPLTYDNINLIRGFEKGLHHDSSEAGFVLTHVDMVKDTPALIEGAVKVISAMDRGEERAGVNDGLRQILQSMEKIESGMEDMWKNSKPQDYISFRTFIFGITSQSMFPNGVIYEGCEDNKPLNFRGESGANDSIIPLLDHLLQIPMPSTPLTKILHEFRSYRPQPHRSFLATIARKADQHRVARFCLADRETATLYLKCLNHVRSFRWRHWMFAREYIIKRTPHPTATGGSPIVTWLPNQLGAVLALMIDIYETVLAEGEGQGKGNSKQVVEMMDVVYDQKIKLAKEVEKYCQERGVPQGK